MIWRLGVLSGVAIVGAGVAALTAPHRTAPPRGHVDSRAIVMLGDSITEQGDWNSLLPDLPIVNQGHSGYTTEQLVPIADSVAATSPRLVLVLTGTNDIRDGRSPAWTSRQLGRVLNTFDRRSPDTSVVIQTVLPRADHPAEVHATNHAVKVLAAGRGVRVLDLHRAFDDDAGALRSLDTTDGVHLSTSGYQRWASLIAPLVAAIEPPGDSESVTDP